MAQTIQRKQKRKQPSAAAVEQQDSTPPAPKRVKVSQAQTARKSTGGYEPPQRRPGRRGGGGGGGDDDDDGDGDGGGGGGGAPRAGPSRQRMWLHFPSKRDMRKLDLCGRTNACYGRFACSHRPKFRGGSRCASQKAAVPTGHGRPSRDSEVPEEHGPAFAQASLCTHRTIGHILAPFDPPSADCVS